MKNYLKLILSILIGLSGGVFGSFFTETGLNSWYTLINKPPITPPNWLFPIAWTTLFILMGLALYFIWSKPKKYKQDIKKKTTAIYWFFAQLIVNISWSFFFFTLKSPLYGLICILVLDAMVLTTIIKFYKVDKKAAYFLIPYMAWISFATVLTFWILLLN